MISYLKGIIKYIGANWLILDVNGVGYKIQLKIENCKLKIDEQCELYIYHHIREDRQELYGFEKMEELQMFEMLLRVSGVGPKIAINILAKANPSKLREAISQGDSTSFTAISGVGKKMAMKILLELKNKINDGEVNFLEMSSESEEIFQALESLGFNKKEVYPYFAKIPSDLNTLPEKIKWILQRAKSR